MSNINASLKFIFNGTTGYLLDNDGSLGQMFVQFDESGFINLMNQATTGTSNKASYIILSALCLKASLNPNPNSSNVNDWVLIDHHKVFLHSGKIIKGGSGNTVNSGEINSNSITTDGLAATKSWKMSFDLHNTSTKQPIQHVVNNAWTNLPTSQYVGYFSGMINTNDTLATDNNGYVLLQVEAFNSQGTSLGADAMRFNYTQNNTTPSIQNGQSLPKFASLIEKSSGAGNLKTNPVEISFTDIND